MTKKSKIRIFMCLASIFCLMPFTGKVSYAAEDGEYITEYITITIDAEDDSDNLMYSIDSTDPGAFTNDNTFTIPANSTHTIYVKDEAGNITSQEYIPDTDFSDEDLKEAPNVPEQPDDTSYSTDNDTYTDIYTYDNTDSTGGDMQDINIELEIGENGKVENINYSGILGTGNGHSSTLLTEPGIATAHDKVTTDGSDSGEKVFYTVTTAEGDTFYMVVDQRQNNDNVYLLNAVTRADLAALAVDGSDEGNINDTINSKDEKEDSLLDALQNEKSVSSNSNNSIEKAEDGRGGGLNPQIIVVVAVLIGGGVYYYLKVYKNKKDEQMDVMDAMDMEDFVSEEAEDEEAEFEYADDEKQEFLNNLINDNNDKENEAFYNTTPEEYAASEEDTASKEDVPITSQTAEFEADYDPELDGEEDWEE